MYLENDWSIKHTLYNDNTSPIKYVLNSRRFKIYGSGKDCYICLYIYTSYWCHIVFNFTVILLHALNAKQSCKSCFHGALM